MFRIWTLKRSDVSQSEPPPGQYFSPQFPGRFWSENAPSGRAFELTMREVDVPNSEKLAQMENITVLKSPYDIYDIFGIERAFEDITQKIRERQKKTKK